MLFSIGILSVVLALTLLFAAFSDAVEDLRRQRDFDALTGTLNRRGFEERSILALPVLADPVSLVVCDIDNFKSINDLHGHDQGDAVLRAVGDVLRSNARKHDVIGRLGGEAFTILMPETDSEEARQCAERLRIAVQNHHHSTPTSALTVTASFDVATRGPSDNWGTLFKRADSRLYIAKKNGRNRVAINDKQWLEQHRKRS